MPTQITITAYRFSELEGQAKDRAREKLSEWRTDHEWWDDIYEDAKERGKELGFEIDDIRFKGFWSQGDGASWTGYIDLLTYIEKHADSESASFGKDMILCELMRNDWVCKTVNVGRQNYRHYCHSSTMISDHTEWEDREYISADVVLLDGVMQGASVKQLGESFDVNEHVEHWVVRAFNDAKEFADDIYSLLGKEYESLVSDESLSDFADLCEYLFDEDGRML